MLRLAWLWRGRWTRLGRQRPEDAFSFPSLFGSFKELHGIRSDANVLVITESMVPIIHNIQYLYGLLLCFLTI
jgi:hypothetical protein